jgi:hypothetical protein
MKNALIALAVLMLHATPAHAQEDARLFLRDIYLTYVEGDGDGVPLTGPVARNVFTDDLAKLIDDDAKKGLARRMNYDPLADAETWEITDLRVVVRPINPTSAIGNVSFLDSGESRMVNVDLVKTKAGWRIDDVQVPDGRLRQLFDGPDPVPEAPISAAPAPIESRASADTAAP